MEISVRWRLLGERRALSLLVLAFYTTMFVLVALSQGGAWARCFGAMALTYGLAFFAVASEWFWGRWFAMGIATSGMTMAVLGLLTNGWNVGLALWGVLHAAVYLPLLGPDMAQRYDGQTAWRERYQLDESSVDRIKRSVQGAAAALPTLILYTLAPRQSAASAVTLLLTAGLLVAALVGGTALLRLRTWGVLVLAGSGVLVAGHLALAGWAGGWTGSELAHFCGAALMPVFSQSGIPALAGLGTSILGLVTAAALLSVAAPFARPAWRTLRGRQSPGSGQG